MTVYFSADHHFGHGNILSYEHSARRNELGRKFKSVEEMNSYLIRRWNERIKPGDTIYYLGDLAYKSDVAKVLPLLHGRKVLIVGNHDPYFKDVQSGNMNKALQAARNDGFAGLHTSFNLDIHGIGTVLLSHFPYWPQDESGLSKHDLRFSHVRPKPARERLLLHGHVHSKWKICQERGRVMINVGVDTWKLMPVSESEVVALFRNFTAAAA